MRLEQFETYLNELLHDIASPLNSMRLQLGLLRDAVRGDDRLFRRVESAERQLFRAQRMLDVFVAACSVKKGRAVGETVVRRVFGRFGIVVVGDTNDAAVSLDDQGLAIILVSLGEAALALMQAGVPRAAISTADGMFLLRVEGELEQPVVARALRLSFVGDDGEPALALATARLAAAAADGALVVDRNAFVLRLPLARV
jgi:hypothetical protein